MATTTKRAFSSLLVHGLAWTLALGPVYTPVVASASVIAPARGAKSSASDEAREALVEAETRLAAGDIDGAAAEADHASALAPDWYAPHLTRDRIAEARVRALGIDPSASQAKAGLDYGRAKALLASGRDDLAKAIELAPEERKPRLRQLAEQRDAEIVQLDALMNAPVPEPLRAEPSDPPPEPQADATAPPNLQELTPEELDRNRRISAEQRKANHLVIAGAVTAGVFGNLGLVGALLFAAGSVSDDEDEVESSDSDTRDRFRRVGTGLLVSGAIGLVGGLTLVAVGSVRKKSAVKRVAKHFRPGLGGLEVRF